jgi:hypothetical protein
MHNKKKRRGRREWRAILECVTLETFKDWRDIIKVKVRVERHTAM